MAVLNMSGVIPFEKFDKGFNTKTVHSKTCCAGHAYACHGGGQCHLKHVAYSY